MRPAKPLLASLVLALVALALPGVGLHAEAIGPKKGKAPTLTLKGKVSPEPARPGEPATLAITIEPPEGIALNRYPGITLKVSKAEGLELARDEFFVGEKEMPEDVTKNQFETVDPLVLDFTPAKRGGKTRKVEGELKFFYCVKKSGFCAPAVQDVALEVAVAR